MIPILWSISYSPWSDQARWALDARGVEYRRRPYRPLLDELALRRRVRRWSGPVSVPILETAGGVLSDSFEIALYADRDATGAGAPLLPVASESRIREYNAMAQRGLAAGRALGLSRMLDDDEALGDFVPPGLRRALGSWAVAMARQGVRRTLRKYAPVTPTDAGAALGEVLDTLRRDLGPPAAAASELRFLLGEFSYADIAMAQVLAFVAPPSTHLRLSPAGRRCYHDAERADRYADLVRWRDALYRECRGEDVRRR